MATNSQFNRELGSTVQGLQSQFDAAVARTVELRDSGATEDVILTQTAVAVKAAKALEVLTGVSWDSRLLDKTAGVDDGGFGPEPAADPQPEAPRRRGLLRRVRTD